MPHLPLWNLPAGTPSPERQYRARILAFFLIAGCALVGITHDIFPFSVLWVIAFGLIYPHLNYAIMRRFPKEHAYSVQLSLFLIDGISAGILGSSLDFNPAIVGFSCILLFATGMLLGGGRWLLAGFAGLLLGGLVGGWLNDWSFESNTPLPIILTVLTGALALVAVAVSFNSKNALALQRQRAELEFKKLNAEHLAQQLSRYLAPPVWQSLFGQRRGLKIETSRKKLTVFFSDIKGFSEVSEELESEALSELLNNYLTEMSRIAQRHGGTIDKFIGDCVMVFFGDPKSQGAKKDALAAVSMAIEMRRHMKVMRQRWSALGITHPLEIRMGLNTGYCTVGNFGSETRVDYTIIGREVNLASRLENAATPGEILISHETYQLIKDVVLCRDQGLITVKGCTRPVQTYQVVDFRRDLSKDHSFIEHELPGFSLYVDTNGIKDFDSSRVIDALEDAAAKLRDNSTS